MGFNYGGRGPGKGQGATSGPRHGHGNRGKRGGGNAYGTNNINMTISQAKKIYANQLAAGYSLQEAMKHNKAETVSFHDLLDDKGDTKKSNSTNNMTLTANQTKLNELYQKNFGRDAGFGLTGGADYWLDTHTPTTQSDWDKIDAMLAGSDEGQKHAGNVAGYNKGQVYVGGIDSTKSIASQSGTPGFWGDHFKSDSTSGLANMNAAAKAQAIADSIGFTPQEAYFNNSVGGVGSDDGTDDGTDDGSTPDGQDGWWNQFDDADAFKDFLKGDDDGMGDFMKFMMLMSVMGGGGMGSSGYGGSSYGYGGLTPGGVMQANDPWSKMKDGFTWFKDSFGSGAGSGTTSDNLNVTGTA